MNVSWWMNVSQCDTNPVGSIASNLSTMLERARRLALPTAVFVSLLVSSGQVMGQASDPAAVQAVRAAVAAQLHANQTDHSTWTYRDHDITPGKNAVYSVVETPQGELKRMIQLNGRPVTADEEQAETDRIHAFVNSPYEQARARRAGAHDDAQSNEGLRMLPEAFLWTIAAQDGETITLNYRPNPDFDPPDMQSRVMGKMAGQMVIARNGNHIRTLKGRLTEDIAIGWGILGRLNAGGTFDIERRDVGGGHWQIVETHVHIGGRAVFFKTIGQQEDDEKTEWRPSGDQTLQAAERTLAAR